MKYFKGFKLSKMRRLVILGVTIVASILTIALGSSLYVSKNARKSIEYGGGAEYEVKIEPGKNISDQKALATQVADEIYNRIDPLSIKGVDVQPEFKNNEAKVRVTYPGIQDDAERDRVEQLITKKPKLIFTDVAGNILFDQYGNFKVTSPGSPKYDKLSRTSLAPLSQGVAAKDLYQGGEHKVELQLNPSKITEWTIATQYISGQKDGANRIVAWINLPEFISHMKNKFPSIWGNSQNNPYIAAHVGSSLRTSTVDAASYLISDAKVSAPLSGSSFVIEGSFSSQEAKNLASNINYGAADYSLKLLYSNYVTASYGTDAFHKAVIAGMIVFVVIAVFLIVNYGLLGALSTISIALYTFITLALFTVMRGEYSPESIAALIIGLGMAVDANIITYERLKNEVYSGSSLQKGYKDANRKSLSSIFDSNITTLIVAFVLFFFGTRNIIGLSVTLILSIMLTLVIMLGFTRFMATMLVKTGMFNDKKHLLGMKPKFDVGVQDKIDKFNFIKNSKWFTYISAAIFTAGLIVLIITASMAASFAGGFHLSRDFTGGTIIELIPGHAKSISQADYNQLTTELANHGIGKDSLSTITNADGTLASIKYSTKDTFDGIENWFQGNTLTDGSKFMYSITTSDVANKLLRDAFIAVSVAIGGIIAYTLIRFKWTYSIAAIIALLHDALIVVMVFVITRQEISPVFVAGLLSIIGYSINDTIVTFDRVRENMTNHVGELTPSKINEIANKSIKETLKRSILTSLTTILAIVILMSFGNATKMSFNIAMLVGLVAGTYSSIFIATYSWTKLEAWRQKSSSKRAEKKFWDTEGVEEQTFKGINDFRS